MGTVDQHLIERYLAHEMTVAELHDFEVRLQTDAVLRQELSEYRLAMDALRLAQREELKARFRKRDKILDREKWGGRNRTLWILSAAAILVLLLGWKFFSMPESATDQADGLHNDTTTLQQPNVIIPDTAALPVPQKETKEKQKPSVKGKELYAAYYEPYMDETMDPVSRSDEELLSAFEKFQLYYAEGKYQDAFEAFSQMEPALQQNDNLRFFYANTLLALNRTGEALPILEAVSKNQKSHYAAESLYFLALAHLHRQELSAARSYLQTYLQKANMPHADDARRLAVELNP
jgi:hypothetical protein